MRKNLIAGLVALEMLGACSGGALDIGKIGFRPSRPAPERALVSDGQVTIAGPEGFCIDPTATRTEHGSSFVLLGSCAAISTSPRKPKPKVPAILTATVSGNGNAVPISASMETLAGFFKSDAGRAALSRSGKPESVTVIEALGKEDVFYIHARDKDADAQTGADGEYWRALFDVKGRIVSASVFGLREHPISSDDSFRTLQDFTQRIRSENQDSSSGPKKSGFPFLKHLFN